MGDPREGLRRLLDAAEDGTLDELCRRHHLRLLGAFGSVLYDDGPPSRDLDLAVDYEAASGRTCTPSSLSLRTSSS